MPKFRRATTKAADGSTLCVPITESEMQAVDLIERFLPVCDEVDPLDLYIHLGDMLNAPYGYCFYAFYLFNKYLQRKEQIVENGTTIGAIAIRDDWDHGVHIAYKSGMPHRVSKKLHAWRKVHNRSLSVVSPGEYHNENQPQPLTWEEVESDLEPWYLGANPQALFEDYMMRVTWPETVLFLYPENWLVPKQIQALMSRIIDEPSIKTAFVITKDSTVLSDFFSDEIIVLGDAQ